jgi:hypothetical protein
MRTADGKKRSPGGPAAASHDRPTQRLWFRATACFAALSLAAVSGWAADDGGAAHEWREAAGPYGDRWAVVPNGGGYLFAVAANRLASPESRATLRLVVEETSDGTRWISDGAISLQVDGYPVLRFPDCAMNPLAGRFGSDRVELFCVSTRDKAVMEIRDRAREEPFIRRLRAGNLGHLGTVT